VRLINSPNGVKPLTVNASETLNDDHNFGVGFQDVPRTADCKGAPSKSPAPAGTTF